MDLKVETTECRRYPMGITPVLGGFHIKVVSPNERCALVLYKRNVKEEIQKIDFPKEARIGDVWSMTVLLSDYEDLEYAIDSGDGIFPDPYACAYSGRDTWGKVEQVLNPKRSPIYIEKFDWQGDKKPELSFDESIIYKLHVRGFTKSSSSKVIHAGTFYGIVEKLSYIKSLGITTVELMPCQEFEEIMMPQKATGSPYHDMEPTGKINYWGYSPSYRFAPKASYCRRKNRNPENELKELIRQLHKEGIEVICEIYFDGSETTRYVLDVLYYWVSEYHIDGIHLVGYPPISILSTDPYLTNTKIIASSWQDSERGRIKHLAEYNDNFLIDMRKFLKGDEGMINRLLFHTRTNPKNAAPINYIANNNGFTIMDMISYDIKHNEANGENNSDGTEFNYSWNCGFEGPTRKKKINNLRLQQFRNAILLVILSQGTPLILAGDEFGRTKKGNNNSYCQDNDISWLNWKLLKTKSNYFEFTKHVIAFRKKHPVFRYPEEPKILDTMACGQPDVSYHGVNAWQPEFENWRRQLGILYCGSYALKDDGHIDETFYVLYNMHWEAHEFALPHAGKHCVWLLSIDTARDDINGFYEEGSEKILEDQKKYFVEARSIVVLTSGESKTVVKTKQSNKTIKHTVEKTEVL